MEFSAKQDAKNINVFKFYQVKMQRKR